MKVARKTVAAWALYDFANSSFTTLTVTFIFSAYFTRAIATDPAHGTVLWTRAVNASALIIAFASPLLGAIADYSARKKLFLLVSTIVCSGGTAMLFFQGPGDVVAAILWFVVANVAFEASNVFYNGFLPEIASKETMGRISGIGWALGYVGGLLCLVIALGMIRGWIPATDDLHVRSSNLLVAGWFLVFSIPMFLFVPERGVRAHGTVLSMGREGFRRIGVTFGRLREYREAAKLLVARLIYNDGLVTVFAFAAIFSAAAFGFSTDQIIVLGITINVAAGVGSFLFGFVDDRIGGKWTIAFTLVVLTAATLYGAWAETTRGFWIASLVLGTMVGPNQAASRSLLAHFVPEDKHAEFFGFFAVSGKLASVLGPLSYGFIVSQTGSQRLAMTSIVVFFVVGLGLLLTVDEEKGRLAGAEGIDRGGAATSAS